MSENNDQQKQLLFLQLTEHLLGDESPSVFINEVSVTETFEMYPFQMLLKLKATEQSAKYHPEGNVWNHTMMVVNEAAKVRSQSTDARSFMWAALLHDIGKPDTTRMRKGKITSYDHDKEGEKLSIDFLRVFTDDETFNEGVAALVRFHMHLLYVLRDMPYADIKGLLKKTDIHELALLCRCDRMGRIGVEAAKEDVEYRSFILKLEKLKQKK